jgi:hypothetical protein
VHILTTLNNGQPANDCFSLFVCEFHRLVVRYPQVNPPTSGVDPQEVSIAKLIAYRRIQDTNRSGYESPTSVANVSTGTTGADRIIVGHIYVKNKLSLKWRECARSSGLLVPWLTIIDSVKRRRRSRTREIRYPRTIDRTDLETGRI